MRTTFGVARLAVEDPVPRAGLRLATADIAVRPPLNHPFTAWLDYAHRKFTGAVREADVHGDLDVGVVAHSLVCFFVAPGWPAARWNRSDGCHAGWPRCGT